MKKKVALLYHGQVGIKNRHGNIVDFQRSFTNHKNTIINNNGHLKAYNTDWVGAYNYLNMFKNVLLSSPLKILGNGGFSKAVQYACNLLEIEYKIIKRNQWNLVPQLDGIIFNCTPVEVNTKGRLIDGRPFTPSGKSIAYSQANEQFKIYTNGIS